VNAHRLCFPYPARGTSSYDSSRFYSPDPSNKMFYELNVLTICGKNGFEIFVTHEAD
jgi:hypothetical protein